MLQLITSSNSLQTHPCQLLRLSPSGRLSTTRQSSITASYSATPTITLFFFFIVLWTKLILASQIPFGQSFNKGKNLSEELMNTFPTFIVGYLLRILCFRDFLQNFGQITRRIIIQFQM